MKSEIFTVIDNISINITNINGKTIDISRMLLTLELYESIFEFFMSGKIIIADTLDLPQNFPIVGNEDVEISLTTSESNKTIKLNYKIYKIDRDLTDVRGDIKRRILSIYICSEEKLKNEIIKLSKKHNGTGNNIISDLMTDISTEKTLTSDTSSDTLEIFSNFWKPTQLIDFVCRLSKTSTMFDFIFFENFDGFNFKTLSNLLNQDPLYDISYSTSKESFIGNRNIKILKFNEFFDINLNNQSGLFGHTFYKPNQTEYSYEKDESELVEVLDNIVTHGLSIPYDTSLSTNQNNISVNYYDPEVSRVRLTSLKLFENYNISIKMNGDFNRKCGLVLNLDYPNYDNENNIHKSFDGRWLILGIKHIIGQNNLFDQNLLLGKNAFFNNSDLERISTYNNV